MAQKNQLTPKVIEELANKKVRVISWMVVLPPKKTKDNGEKTMTIHLRILDKMEKGVHYVIQGDTFQVKFFQEYSSPIMTADLKNKSTIF